MISRHSDKNYWVLPSGRIKKGETKEHGVFEEAGIGTIVISSIGEFTINKRYHQTTLILLFVIEIYDK